MSNGARAALPNGKELPARLKILDWGKNETLKGTYVVDEGTAAVFDANQKSIGRGRVALDYEHNTVPGSDEFKRTQEPRPVAAYFTPKVIPGEGLFLEDPDWTPSGKVNALNYEDLSAAPFVDGVLPDGPQRVIGLHSAALTKAGASDFTFFSSAEDPMLAGMLETLSANTTKTRDQDMDKETTFTVAELGVALGLKADAKKSDVLGRLALLSAAIMPGDLAVVIGLTADAKREDVIKALSARLPAELGVPVVFANRVKVLEEKLTELPKVVATLSATGADGKVIPLSVDDLVKRIVSMESAQQTVLLAAESNERAGLIAGAAKAGKVIPLSADLLKSLPLPALREMVEKLPANVVPLNSRARLAVNEGRGSDDELKGADRLTAAMAAEKEAGVSA